MKPNVYKNIELNLQPDYLTCFEGLSQDSEAYRFLMDMAQTIGPSLEPRGALLTCPVEILGENQVSVGGTVMESRLVSKKLSHQKAAVVALTTIGGVEKLSEGNYLDTLKGRFFYAVLHQVRGKMKEMARQLLQVNDVSELNPGSLPDWPICHNRHLFDLLGDTVEELGVTLRPDGFMAPVNTTCGIYFSDDSDYVNCRLCKKLDCIGRREPFDAAGYTEMFGE